MTSTQVLLLPLFWPKMLLLLRVLLWADSTAMDISGGVSKYLVDAILCTRDVKPKTANISFLRLACLPHSERFRQCVSQHFLDVCKWTLAFRLISPLFQLYFLLLSQPFRFQWHPNVLGFIQNYSVPTILEFSGFMIDQACQKPGFFVRRRKLDCFKGLLRVTKDYYGGIFGV